MKITYTDTGANGHFPALTGAKEPEDDTNHGYIRARHVDRGREIRDNVYIMKDRT